MNTLLIILLIISLVINFILIADLRIQRNKNYKMKRELSWHHRKAH